MLYYNAMLYRKFILLLSCLATALLPAAALKVKFGADEAFLGDAFPVIVSSDDTVLQQAKFTFSKAVRIIGRGSSTSIVNGRGSSSLNYSLVPADGAGEYRLESLTAVDQRGNVLTYDGHPTFTVKAPTPDPDVTFTVTADAAEVFPGDAVTVTLAVEAPGILYGERLLSPFSGGQPKVNFAAEFEDDAPLRLEQRGVQWATEKLANNHLRHTAQLTYRAIRGGEANFGTPVLRDDRILSIRLGHSFFGEPVLEAEKSKRCFAFAEPLKITVKLPPAEGRPEGYTGAIATAFSAEASTDTLKASVGDPIRLTLVCRTDSTDSTLRAPTLPAIPGMRAYGEAKCETFKDGARMEYLLRPTRPGRLEIPPLKLSWYDRAERAYKTVTTGAVPVRVLASAQMLLDGLTADRTPPPLLTETSPQPTLTPDRWALSCPAAALLLLLLRLLAGLLRAPLARLRERRRKASPAKAALNALAHAETAAEAITAVRTWSGHPALTSSELARRLPDTPEASDAVAALASLEQAVYGGGADIPEARQTLLRLLPGLRKTLRVLILLALPLLPALADAALADDAAFLREEAVARSLSATEQKDYAAAADCWLRLARDGDLSRSVLMNAASCALLAGAPSAAQNLYERCAWLYGPDADIRRGLTAAADRLQEPEPSLRQAEILRGSGLFGGNTLCISLGILLLLLVLPRKKRLMRRLLLLAILWTLLEALAYSVLLMKAYGTPLPELPNTPAAEVAP